MRRFLFSFFFLFNYCLGQIPCNNWLHLPANPSFVNAGDLDVPGDKITVEAVFYQTGNSSFEGDLVTKHNTPADVNYLLRPNHAYITTDNGYFETPDVCTAELNKRYHVAMVYDGITLKFYRNGFLLSQVNASGNLFQNNWQTQIGWYAPQFWNSNFIGYVNEVRIWNVARTQSEVRNSMDNSLPNPSLQNGLLAYYTFDDLINKQGNTAWDGSLNGTASISNVIPNCSFSPDSCGTVVTSTCDNWLHIPNYNTTDYVAIGDLDMTGDKITVEAQFAADTNYFIPSTISYDLVSKHTDPSDCNYLLRPVTAEITTTNGFFQIIACDYKPRKINHAALVYDGSTLKFYRNGFLMGSKPASGNLITNDLITKIGNYSFGSLNGSLKGYMNEVRIWNIARTQDEIKTYMNAPLPNPTTQTGLVAYYQFDDLNNKQGNAAWNGTLNGAATINNTVPDCNFIADSCIVITEQQTCSGSFGNPVVNITFGSSASNPGPQLSVAVPGASTNYNFANYANGTPPSAPTDGDYALINQVPVNGAWYTGAKDHTGNPDGYMAFFNSSPTPGDFYRQTVFNLCPGTTYEFSAWIANVINPSVLPSAILPNITFKILDPITSAELATFNTGDIPNESSMMWKQHSFLFTLPSSNSSVTLVLSNNNIGGNAQPGNDLAIDDITFKPCGPLTNASFSAGTQIDSAGTNNCSRINLFGNITGSFNNPAYQWQISNDAGVTFTDIAGAITLNAVASNLSNGQYIVRLLSAESGNINSTNCRFISNKIKLTVSGCVTSVTGISGIINYYTPVIAFNPCYNKITVEDGSGFKVGDTVLMIQMKGAVIDSTNTASFGTITDYKNAGNYEFNYVKSVTGNIVELKNVLQRQYDIPLGRVQLIRVPYYQSVVVVDTLTCLPWDGRKGGVLVFNVEDTIKLNKNIDVSGKGFLGGKVINTNALVVNCFTNSYYNAAGSINAAPKGESVYDISVSKKNGKGKLASAGGGGLDHNSGGGGGANGGGGGFGGYQLEDCSGGPFDNRGIGGDNLAYSNVDRKIFLGGGGGAGHCNNPGGVNMDGGNGGGIVIIKSGYFVNNSFSILDTGMAGYQCIQTPGAACNDGSGGGGSGGTVLLTVNNFVNPVAVNLKGGKGADLGIYQPAIGSGRMGPGGGGGGGVLWLSQLSAPGSILLNNSGGAKGVIPEDNNNPWGTTSGQNGLTLFTLATPIDTIPFKPNIDSVRINDSIASCKTLSFKGLAFINAAAIQSWEWSFGDNSFASTQNSSHTYNNAGNYNVKLVVTDINGCKDSILKRVSVVECSTDIKGIINYYTPVIAFNPCNNSITVEDASGFKVGDTTLIIQMKGAVIDSTNTASFGTITDYNNAGNYEFNYVKSITGNIVELKNVLQRQYDIPLGRVQLIRVPFYKSVVVTDTLTCLPWDGRKGGVLVFNVEDTVELNADINTTGMGFKKGIVHNSNLNSFTCGVTGYYYPDNTTDAAGKGEGITALSVNRNSGNGPAANGGGGGLNTNSGGGGGANGNRGGRGGDELNNCPNHATSGNWGLPGTVLNYNTASNKIFMGGGGGAGHCNNQFYDPSVNADFNGGQGGGIVIISSNYIKNNNRNIISKGDSAYQLNIPNSFVSHDGMGGGGAGGTVLLNCNNYINNLLLDISGGKGGDMVSMPSGGLIGPGGGGGGGVAWVKQPALPPVVNITNTGGNGGVIIQNGNDPYGATAGLAGINVFSLSMIIDDVPFRKNIDSVRINDSIASCKTLSFKGLAFINTAAIQNWQWSFGDNNFASTQNTAHTYTNTGNYNVKLVVTDINGCKDSITKAVRVDDCPPTTINEYAAVFAIDICNNTITVDDATKFNAGDTIVIMQMKGAAIDSVNTNNFGTITNYNNAGRYEFNYVKNKTGNTIELLNTFLNRYDAAFGKVQLIRVPYFQTLTVTQALTCTAWDGAKGGVLVLNSANDIILNAPVDVSNKGFRGGAIGGGFSCGNIDQWAAPVGVGGTKGEGITEYIPGLEAGGAKLANGGGAAYAANSGGGGGGNYGAGGLGGFHSNTCPLPTQSINGQAIDYTINNNNVFLGGAGGGGQQDNGAPVAAGGNGGGIVIIKAATLNSNNQSIVTNGETITTMVEDEGGAGGGAGGSVLLYVNNYLGTVEIDANGGDGSSNHNQIYPGRCHGPGGGGGGGYVGLSVAANPGGLLPILNGGNAGTVQNPSSACYTTTDGASNGVSGGINFNLVLPEATVPFKKNIDSVRINENLTACKTFNLNGIAFTNTSPIQNWQWNFGDGGKDSIQNTSHTYNSNGSHTVKLIATDINGCRDSISKIVTINGINFDFVFEQDACNPLLIHFRAIGDTTAEIFWSKGDGTIITDIRNPTHLYPGIGSYLVEYCTGNASTGCIDTVRKTIFVGWINDNIVITPDTTICYGANKLLRSNIDSTLQFCWSPNSFLNNVSFANPTTSTPSTITYTLMAAREENNLVVNGNFNNGNTGFTTDYDAGTTPLSSAEYFVAASSLNTGPAAADCKDHTTGTGNMLVARNDFSAISQVWGQSVTVSPNTNYVLSAWVQSLVSRNNAFLQLSINGNVAKDSIRITTPTCAWVKYSVLWNSGNNTTADLSIINKPVTPGIGGYFAIDDISLSSYSIKKDTVRITVDTPFVDTRTDTAICKSVSVTLNTTGAYAYSWTPTTGLSNASIANPVATPADTTKYFVTGTNVFGCKATDSVTIAVKPQPIVTSTGDTLICRNTAVNLFASGGTRYLWTPAVLLNNPNIANPTANPSIVNTKYVVAVTGANNCVSKDSFTVSVQPIPVYTVSADKSVCIATKPQLNASGGNYYLWSPASSVSNANISNPLAIATITTPYSVLVRDTLCGYDSTLITTITVLPLPTITAAKENDINCALGTSQLSATGALQYNWSPAATLNDAGSATPIASNVNTTAYTVKGTDNNGCSNTASVTVFADYTAKVSYAVPNAFSPNGDDRNECFRVKYFGLISELQFAIYNRWGEKVFFTSNPNDCWDGTYKGAPCDPGNFVYYIKAKTTCGPVERKGNVLLIR